MLISHPTRAYIDEEELERCCGRFKIEAESEAHPIRRALLFGAQEVLGIMASTDVHDNKALLNIFNEWACEYLYDFVHYGHYGEMREREEESDEL